MLLDIIHRPVYYLKQHNTAIVNDTPSSRQRRCYIRTITAGVLLENKITGRGSQGASRQDELIGAKPPVVK
jgi:hypothetical protein